MNFFGHAAVAAWRRRSGMLALGAMLPDFASMARARVSGIASWEIAEGIELHHRTDGVFHGSATFVGLCTRATRELGALGFGRGSARAVAHVATELLLDGTLLSDPASKANYLEALELARDDAVDATIEWRTPEEHARFRALAARLASYGVPAALGEPSFVAARVIAALAPRPKLALDAAGEAALPAHLEAHRVHVLAAAPALLEEIRAALASA